jgi:16S rRNA (guanine527-N7)-methyltransferase
VSETLDKSHFGSEQFLAATNVSRETLERVKLFDGLFVDWSGRLNLVAKSTIPDRWQRHYLDSFQLMPLLPKDAKRVMDFGSGGGFPGIFLALLHACGEGEGDTKHFYLVESIAKKCAFLREVAAVLKLENVTILNQRIEAVTDPKKADVITARALASLDKLLGYAQPFLKKESVCLFPKGEKADEELTAASAHWKMQVIPHRSVTHADACILEIRDIHRV